MLTQEIDDELGAAFRLLPANVVTGSFDDGQLAVRERRCERLRPLEGLQVLRGMDDERRRLDLTQARPVVETHHRLPLPPQRASRWPSTVGVPLRHLAEHP